MAQTTERFGSRPLRYTNAIAAGVTRRKSMYPGRTHPSRTVEKPEPPNTPDSPNF